MKAMVLAAGLGERLRPATERCPKPLFPVLGVPAIEWVLCALRCAGVRDVVVNLHHLPAQVVRRLGNGARLGLRISYSDEPILLGTGGGLWAVREFFRAEDAFFVHNGDVWHDWDLNPLIEFHRRQSPAATLALVSDPDQPEAHLVELDALRVIGIRGRPRSGDGPRYVFSGVSVQTPAVLESLPEGEVSCLVERGLIPMLASGAEIAGFLQAGSFCDIGTPRRYLDLQWSLLDSDPARLFASRGLTVPVARDAGVWSLGNPTVQAQATIRPPVWLCDRARIESGATIGPRVVVCERAVIRSGATVHDAVVFEGTVVDGPAEGLVL